jgi:hypothetical protein
MPDAHGQYGAIANGDGTIAVAEAKPRTGAISTESTGRYAVTRGENHFPCGFR